MIEETLIYLLIYMLLAVSFGFVIGWACGDEYRRRVNAEEQVDELSEAVEDLKEQIKLLSNTPSPAVSKGSPEHPG
jgi:cell division protein FtsB